MKIRIVLFVFVIVFSSCSQNHRKRSSVSVNEKYISGKVIKIIDGDTYDLLTDDKRTIRIRMEGIDTPEKGMPYYKVAKNYLGNLCMNQTIKIENNGEDDYGRILAYSYLSDGSELGHMMIEAGMAWHFKKYNDDEDLAALEVDARNNKVGLWADKCPIPPWEVRRLQREGMSNDEIYAEKKYQYCN